MALTASDSVKHLIDLMQQDEQEVWAKAMEAAAPDTEDVNFLLPTLSALFEIGTFYIGFVEGKKPSKPKKKSKPSSRELPDKIAQDIYNIAERNPSEELSEDEEQEKSVWLCQVSSILSNLPTEELLNLADYISPLAQSYPKTREKEVSYNTLARRIVGLNEQDMDPEEESELIAEIGNSLLSMSQNHINQLYKTLGKL